MLRIKSTLSQETERVATEIVDAAYKIHKTLGPGLLESVYEACMVHELRRRKLKVQKQVHLPVSYEGIRIDSGLRLDLLVEDSVIVELKAVEALLPLHKAQVLTYMKLSNFRLALLINFNSLRIKNGIHRFVL